MKTLEQIKDDYVMDNFLASHELDTWIDFQNYFASRHPEWFEQHWEEIAQRYATEYAKEALRLASENARVMTKNIDTENELEVLSWTDSRNVKFSVSKQSILSENNLPSHS